MTGCFLSIIIPVYNEEIRLPNTLDTLISFLRSKEISFEVIIVENGSTDQTYRLAQNFAERNPEVRVLQEKSRGKGLAVQLGMQSARGEYCFMCDVDFSMPVDYITRFLPPYLCNYEFAIASREAPGSIRFNEPIYRHMIGRMFNILIRWIALPGFRDTQCGFKCFHMPEASILFNCQTITGWTFDVELLFLALKLRYRIIEVPIPWYYNPASKVHLVRDSIQMIRDILRIRINVWKGVYANCFTDLGNINNIK